MQAPSLFAYLNAPVHFRSALDMGCGPRLNEHLPKELGSLSDLEGVWLHRNDLTGETPKELADLTNLEKLPSYGNRLTGEIPAELGGLSRLERLYLHYNELTGEIPAELGRLFRLTNLWLNSNRLTGTIPSELSKAEVSVDDSEFSNLELWRLRDNQLTGCVLQGQVVRG